MGDHALRSDAGRVFCSWCHGYSGGVAYGITQGHLPDGESLPDLSKSMAPRVGLELMTKLPHSPAHSKKSPFLDEKFYLTVCGEY